MSSDDDLKEMKEVTPSTVRNIDTIEKFQVQIDKMKRQMQMIYNHLEFNQHLNNKKALFINMRNYYTYCCENEDVFNTLPLTFHIKTGIQDSLFAKFKTYFE